MKIKIATYMLRAANMHIEALEKMFESSELAGYAIYDFFLQAERVANRMATNYCNGLISSEEFEKWQEKFTTKLTNKLGLQKMPDGFFINGDPRGYSLKMKRGKFEPGLSQDWGGYGCLGASFE